MGTILNTPEPVTEVTNDPRKPIKAIVAGVIGAVGAGLGALVTALSDNLVTPQEWATIALAVVVTAGGAFGGTFAATNPKAVVGE